jgi:hypothetical protein
MKAGVTVDSSSSIRFILRDLLNDVAKVDLDICAAGIAEPSSIAESANPRRPTRITELPPGHGRASVTDLNCGLRIKY